MEARSIDYVPRAERHGRVWHQGPFWFSGNFILVAMLSGFIGPGLGLTALWSFVAIVLGAGAGTFFMAFHANQGPRMGVPQMIQSRAQFGVRGAIVPFVVVVFVYAGFSVFNTVLAADIIGTFVPGGLLLWGPVVVILGALVAIVGHDLLHTLQRWLTYVLVPLYAVLAVTALVVLDPDSGQPQAGFSWSAFLIQFSAATAYQISYAVYVSDYTRYLPADVPARPLIAWVYVGAASSAWWMMGLAALVASAVPGVDVIASVRQLGDHVFPGFGAISIAVSLIPLISVTGINLYGAMLTGISAVDGIRPVRPNVRTRMTGVLAVAAVVLIAAITLPENYIDSFEHFVTLMLAFLIPWTAINLVDFYLVRRGHYAVAEIFKQDSLYRKWSWRGLVSYFVGLVAVFPFTVAGNFEGWGAQAMGGLDLSFVPGLLVPGLTYYCLTRSLDLEAEKTCRGGRP